MLIEFTEEQLMLQKTIRNFAEKEVAPIAEEIDRHETFPMKNFKKLGELGVLGITVPPEYGGAGSGYVEMGIVCEELSRVCLSTGASYAAHADLCVDNLRRNGSERQNKKYLPGLCSGEKIGGLAMTEPSAGSDVLSMRLRADKNDDHYVLNGSKTFITNGPVGDIFVVYAKTDMEKGPLGVTAFIIEKGFPGFSAGKKFEKMGWRGSPTGELIFDNCHVPKENVLGHVGGGANVLMSGLNTERIIIGATCIGLSQGALELALKYSKERVQFGKPISSFQLIQGKLADMAMEVEISRIITYYALKYSDNVIHGPAIKDDRALMSKMNLLASYVKLYTSEVSIRVTNEALQILGGYGYIREFPAERMVRDARLMTIGGGTSEIQRLIIAREILR